jgi:hypothetical protein
MVPQTDDRSAIVHHGENFSVSYPTLPYPEGTRSPRMRTKEEASATRHKRLQIIPKKIANFMIGLLRVFL